MKYGEMSLLDFVFPLIWETGEREREREFLEILDYWRRGGLLNYSIV